MTLSSSHDNLNLNLFNKDSVAFVPSLYSASLCSEVRNYILDREQDIINSYANDNRGLVCELVNGTPKIKYFEYPFHYDALFFGRFLNSRVFEIASILLNSDVRFVSAEIHSRFPNATSIPPHQDNAYYGLDDAKGLTFYIALDQQSPAKGGLQYLRNPIVNEFPHKASSASGFSLEIEDHSKISDLQLFSPEYSAGDCSIHHSRSVHFANPAPSSSDRSFVFRFSLFSIHSSKIPGHDERYKKAIASNRALFN
jgi:hypothetical protein